MTSSRMETTSGVSGARLLRLTTLLAAVVQCLAEERIAMQAFRAIINERTDPVISPGQVSQHLHRVIGANNFGPYYDPDVIRSASCTNIDVQADKSNYWTPTLFYKFPNGSYVPLGGESRVYYETLLPIGDGSSAVQTEPFPYSFQMIAGSPMRKSLTWFNTFQDYANFFYCATSLDGSQGYQTWNFPTSYCYYVVTKTYFPTCWNGQAYNVSSPYAHVTYPLDNIGVGGNQICPVGYERRLPLILLETFYYQMSSIDPNAGGKYIFANGDLTGWGLHADFANGWDINVLTAFVYDPRCQRPAAAAPANICPPLAPSYDRQAAEDCRFSNKQWMVNELNGFEAPLTSLPGCNLDWGTSLTKPICKTPKVPFKTPKLWAPVVSYQGYDISPSVYKVGYFPPKPVSPPAVSQVVSSVLPSSSSASSTAVSSSATSSSAAAASSSAAPVLSSSSALPSSSSSASASISFASVVSPSSSSDANAAASSTAAASPPTVVLRSGTSAAGMENIVEMPDIVHASNESSEEAVRQARKRHAAGRRDLDALHLGSRL